MRTHKELLDLAKTDVLDYIKSLEVLDINEYAILLIGSVATGHCHEGSDIDIKIVCKTSSPSTLKNFMLKSGSSQRVMIKETPVHYSFVSLDKVLKQLDFRYDTSYYTYSTAIYLEDKGHIKAAVQKGIEAYADDESLLADKIDYIRKRKNIFIEAFTACHDPYAKMKMSMELIEQFMIASALKDKIAYDSRRHMYETSLFGVTGKKMKPIIDFMMTAYLDDKDIFINRVEEGYNILL